MRSLALQQSHTRACTYTPGHMHTHAHTHTHTHVHTWLYTKAFYQGMHIHTRACTYTPKQIQMLGCTCMHTGEVRFRALQQKQMRGHWAHTWLVGLARTIYIYGILGREITKYTVIYGVYIRFWPTLMIRHTLLYFCKNICGGTYINMPMSQQLIDHGIPQAWHILSWNST